MKRILSTIRCDVRLQWRNGFYYAAAFVAVLFIVIVRQLPQGDWRQIWPGMILENLIISTFFFMSGLVLLEKGQGTLEAQVVTPLRPGEYLASKAATLAGLATVETLVMVLVTVGLHFNPLPLLGGILLMAGTYALYGFVAVSRYDAINEFLMPSMVWTLAFSLALVPYFGLWEHPLFYLHPLLAPLMLMKAAFGPVEVWQVAYGLLYGGLWLGIAFVWSRRSYHRFVVRKEGVR